MAELSRRSLLAGAAAGLAVAGTGSSLLGSSAQAAPASSLNPVHVPPKALRGFGSLQADFTPLGNHSSLLQIQCQTTDLARLAHAKYLSDLILLPGVTSTTLTVGGLRIPAYKTSAGVVAALTARDSVVILAADDQQSFNALAKRAIPRQATAADFVAQAAVPLYLDRFDKYGLLLYFVPFQLPPGWDRSQVYDYSQDFDFAQDNGLGITVWDNEQQYGTSEGLARMPDWAWVVDECAARGIPVHLNTQAFGGLWLSNRYRDQTMQKMPQYSGFVGGAASYNNAVGLTSLSATTGLDAELGVLQETVRAFAPSPNVVGWLEPHSEISGGPASVLLAEFGDVCDKTYRTFLKDRYVSLGALGRAWYGDPAGVRSWDDVHVPEVASFLGWGPDAIDVAGSWRVLAPGTVGSPAGWDQPGFDDSGWGTLIMPGSDRVEFLPKQALDARRVIDVSAGWLAAHPRAWLYVFDLNSVNKVPLPVTINGHQTGGVPPTLAQHCGAVEVSGLLQAGSNLIALTLPNGYMGYRCYLSGDAPVQYPSLGAQRNAQWIDFQDWSRWTRSDAVRRGVEMIRQEDPNRPINLMSPDTYADLIKPISAQYGGTFHNTGYAAGFWAEYHPLLSRSAGRPATAEPGNGPATGAAFKQSLGRWISEGLNGIHYFANQTDLMYRPDVLQLFQGNRAMYESIGKYHVPTAEVAVLYGLRINGHGSWPWVADPNTWLPGGYYGRNIASPMLSVCPRDGVTEVDFADGTVDQYKVIVDSNTSIMDEALVSHIETWIRNGGTFISFVQTGRHTTTQVNSWPIGRLTGYDVLSIDSYTSSLAQPGQESYIPELTHGLKAAPGQRVFTDHGWLSTVQGSGLSLKRAAADARDLLLWEDGAVAAGMRPLGRGRIIQLGCHFEEILDRNPAPNTTTMLTQIMDYLDVQRVPAQAANVVFRHFISNTGLHDVWVLYNDSANPVTTNLLFTTAPAPTVLTELNAVGTTINVTTTNGTPGAYGLALAAWDTRILLSPRADTPASGLEWLTLQRNWWSGTTTPGHTPLPTPAQEQRNSVDFTNDWSFLPVDTLTPTQILALTGPGVDDTAWEHRDLGIWTMPDHPDVHHAVLRKHFTIPDDWTTGETQLWLHIDKENTIFHDKGRIYLDGILIQDLTGAGLAGLAANTLLPPGQHLMALEVQGTSTATGITANAWAYHVPEPESRQDLTGTWTLTGADGLHDTGQAVIPGAFTAAFAARDVTIDAGRAGASAVLYIRRPNTSINGILINGTFIGDIYPATKVGDTLLINITNKILYGQTNRIELATSNATEPTNITTIEIRYYNPTTYP